MIDRELFPKRKHARARKKYVRTVRQRSNTVVCDLITDDGETLVLPMTATLQHHEIGEHMPRGRQRVHRLPANIADALTKALESSELQWHMEQAAISITEGRHDLMPEVGNQ